MAWRNDKAVIVDAKAAKPNPSQEIQVMLYMTWIPMLDPSFRNIQLSGEVYYGENAVIDIPAASVYHRFKEVTAGLIGRVTSRTPQEGAQRQRVPLLSHRQPLLPQRREP